MKRLLTWILAVGLLAVAGLYLASVIWPPPGEGGPGEGAYPLLARPGVQNPEQPDPAVATPYDNIDVFRDTVDGSDDLPEHLKPRLWLKVTNQSGEGLANSEVRIFLAGGGGKVARTGKTDAEGKLLLEDLELGSYLIECKSPGYFDAASRTVSVPTGRKEPEQVVLTAGATLLAHIQDEYGRTRVDGVIMLQNTQGTQRYLVRADSQGDAMSATLPGGAWVVSWREHQYADVDTKLQSTIAAVPGDRVEYWITLPVAPAAKPPADGTPRYAVGLTLALPQAL